MIQTTRFATCLGLLAGSLAIATSAHADIPITGGQVTGEAAFFTQTNLPALNRTGSPILFDTAIQTLRIVTPNGTTTTSRFLPNAARFNDVNSNSRADAGDKGTMEGALSGVAFNPSGFPVFFQNIPTTLDFTLTAFNPSSFDIGSLISPKQLGTAPLVFLPGINVTLSSTSSNTYESKLGLLEIGAFSANLTGDFIGLPSDLKFRPSSSDVTLVPVFLGRRVKFDFEGKNAQVETAEYGTNSTTGKNALQFEGEVTNFQVQSVGTSGSREFKITGSGDLELQLTGPFDIKNNSLTFSSLEGGQANYRIKGEGPGFIAATGNNSVTYSGTSRRDTDFKFEKGSQTFEGKSSGDVSFTVSDDRDSVNFNSFNVPAVGVTTTTTTGAPSVSSSGSSSSTSTSSSTSSSSTISLFTTTVFTNTTITNFPRYYSLLIETSRDQDDDGDDDDDNTTNVTNGTNNTGDNDDDNDDDDDDNDSQLYGNNVVYYVYAPQRRSTEVVVERQGDRILLVDRSETRGRKLKKRGQVVGAYQVVGLPSRVFPGMTGLRQLPPEQVQSTTGTDDNANDTTETGTTGTGTTGTGTTGTGTTGTGTTGTTSTTPANTNSGSTTTTQP